MERWREPNGPIKTKGLRIIPAAQSQRFGRGHPCHGSAARAENLLQRAVTFAGGDHAIIVFMVDLCVSRQPDTPAIPEQTPVHQKLAFEQLEVILADSLKKVAAIGEVLTSRISNGAAAHGFQPVTILRDLQGAVDIATSRVLHDAVIDHGNFLGSGESAQDSSEPAGMRHDMVFEESDDGSAGEFQPFQSLSGDRRTIVGVDISQAREMRVETPSDRPGFRR